MWKMYTEAAPPPPGDPKTLGGAPAVGRMAPTVAPPSDYHGDPSQYRWDAIMGQWVNIPDSEELTRANDLARAAAARQTQTAPASPPKISGIQQTPIPDDIARKGGGVVDSQGKAHTVAPPTPELPTPAAELEPFPTPEEEDPYKEMVLLLVSFIRQSLSQGKPAGDIVDHPDFQKMFNSLPAGHKDYLNQVVKKSVGA